MDTRRPRGADARRLLPDPPAIRRARAFGGTAPIPRGPVAAARTGFRALGRHRPASRGQALVELALVVPILLVLVLAALDLGRVYYARITVENAAREGALQASIDPADGTKIAAAATRETAGSLVTVAPADVSYTCTPGYTKSYGTECIVNVVGRFTLLTPLMAAFTGGQNVTFTSTANADVIYIPPPPATPTPTATATATATATPNCSAPLVSFTASQQNKTKPVVFTSTSSPVGGECGITYWRWEFGDGATDAGNTPSTTHDYGSTNRGRSFSVRLTVTYAGGTQTATLTQSITTLG